MNQFVLDASALLAFLNAERGADRVTDVIFNEKCALLTINLTETLTRLADWHVPLTEAQTRLDALDLHIISFDQHLAFMTAELRTATRYLGLSLGDRACLALAQQHNATALTADRSWIKLDIGIKVECIRD